MTEQQRINRIPFGAVAAVSAAVVAAGGIGAWLAMNSQSPTPPSSIATSVQPPATNPPVQTAEQTAQIYWLRDTGSQLELVPKPVTVSADLPNDVLAVAFNSLLAGPTDTALASTIPEGTKLRSLTRQNDGIRVDLSKEFTTGGGSSSMTGRVAQVVYTATSLQPDAKVWIDVEGKQLEVLGGEGLLLEQPITRQSFQENFTL